ncbi:MAG: DUF4097 family beta strand repeat-containing protein [Candidatus Acidiferrales bacterium]
MNVLSTRWELRGVSAVALAAGLFFVAPAPASAHRLEKHFAVEAHPIVTVHNPNGTITIRAWNKPEVVVIANHSSDKVEVDAEQLGNRIELLTHTLSDSIGPDDLHADYQVTVPEDAELEIHNDAGTVDVGQVLGDMAVETVGAGVNLSDAAGYLTVKTVDGSFQCMRCAGRIEVTSISGNVQLLQVRSYNIRAQTSKGNILFDGEFLPNGVYRLRNYSGVIEVRFSPGDSFDLSATSLKGKVNNQAVLTPHSHTPGQKPKFGSSLLGTFNQGRAKVELSSFDGTINVHRRD